MSVKHRREGSTPSRFTFFIFICITYTMKNYIFTTACLIVSIILQVFRGYPGAVTEIIAGAILVTSYVTTFLGVRAAADTMWPRMAMAILAPAILGIAQS